jgi:hypothetical protein
MQLILAAAAAIAMLALLNAPHPDTTGTALGSVRLTALDSPLPASPPALAGGGLATDDSDDQAQQQEQQAQQQMQQSMQQAEQQNEQAEQQFNQDMQQQQTYENEFNNQ